MKWEFSTSYQGLGSKSPTVQRWLKQKGSRVIIEFDKVLSHSIILPPRLSKIIPGISISHARTFQEAQAGEIHGEIWCNMVQYCEIEHCTALYKHCTWVFKDQGSCIVLSAPPGALRSRRKRQRHTTAPRSRLIWNQAKRSGYQCTMGDWGQLGPVDQLTDGRND